MKNLLVYLSPHKRFNSEHLSMIEIQIENSLLYWKPEDIVLFTNFPYEYRGIKAIVAPDIMDSVSKTNPKALRCVKVNAIIYLLENKILTEPTWNHDLDAFQLAPLDVKLEKDMGVVCYGRYPKSKLSNLGKEFENRVNFGNVFFKPEALDIFKKLLKKIDREELFDEDGMTLMLDELKNRVQIMNQTYNIGIRCVRDAIRVAKKPLRIVHFPPHEKRWREKFRPLLAPKLREMIDERFGLKGLFYPDAPFDSLYIPAILDEIYTKKLYDNVNGVVVDLGANIGLTTQYLRECAERVYAVEPAREHFTALKRNKEFNYWTNVEVFNVAISDQDGEAMLSYNLDNRTSHSLFREKIKSSEHKGGIGQGGEMVKTMRLDTFFQMAGIERVDFLKMDVESAEEVILRSGGFRNVAKKIKKMLVEFHTNDRDVIRDLLRVIKKEGFRLVEWKMRWIAVFKR